MLNCPPEKQLLVTKRTTGLGSDLASVIGCWDYARRSGRDLVINWRGSRYCRCLKTNLFSQLFRLRSDHVGGVRIRMIEDIGDYPDPVIENFSGNPSFDQLSALLCDNNVATVVNRASAHVLPGRIMQRKFLSNLLIADCVEAEADSFSLENFADSVVVGVHIRHGNGENLMGKNPSRGTSRDEIMNELGERVIDRVKAAVDKIARRSPNRLKVFVATDSYEVESSLKSCPYPVYTIEKRFRPEGTGPIHIRSSGLQGANDALLDMILLSRCDFLIHNSSWFTHYARILGRWKERPVNITPEDYYGSPEFRNPCGGNR